MRKMVLEVENDEDLREAVGSPLVHPGLDAVRAGLNGRRLDLQIRRALGGRDVVSNRGRLGGARLCRQDRSQDLRQREVTIYIRSQIA